MFKRKLSRRRMEDQILETSKLRTFRHGADTRAKRQLNLFGLSQELYDIITDFAKASLMLSMNCSSTHITTSSPTSDVVPSMVSRIMACARQDGTSPLLCTALDFVSGITVLDRNASDGASAVRTTPSLPRGLEAAVTHFPVQVVVGAHEAGRVYSMNGRKGA